ncbi:MAG TPA: crosslink repair DNA glycosylase YcaQ family protein [Candidatus Polarisedimenticolia bacterium]|nr:crosslink repair DNA glycosylase YcaQ family protein [Candidatus Polarisedimenticolia bacterium]
MRISREVARRFLLGRQGLWPGRRWRAADDGTATAMRAMGNLQLDPLRIISRAQDLALNSRVIGYREDDWARLTYSDRKFFEWGGWLAVRPIEELPYYRVLMRRAADIGPRLRRYRQDHGPAIEEVRALLRERGELSNRDFAMGDRTRVNSYRGRKDSAIALYYLWMTGDAMVTRRERFERVYAPAESVAPARYLREAPEAETDDFIALRAIDASGFMRPTIGGLKWTILRDVTSAELKAWRARQIGEGVLAEIEVEGLSGKLLTRASNVATFATLADGRIPKEWTPLEAMTEDEITFLSPLDPVIGDRARTKRLWDFDYMWEVYTKVEKRRFGYYALPMLWGDRLVGRMDAKANRVTSKLEVLGTWFEDGVDPKDPALRAALDRGLERLRTFVTTKER